VNPVSDYPEFDIPPECPISDNVLTMHDENGMHFEGANGQYTVALSPIVDRTDYPSDIWTDVLVEGTIFMDMPQSDGVLLRTGWMYYPYYCGESGVASWSPRVGSAAWGSSGIPYCLTGSESGTEYIPQEAHLIRGVIEVLACCGCFGIPDCPGGPTGNASPFFDNYRIGLLRPGTSTDVDQPPTAEVGPTLSLPANPVQHGTGAEITFALPEAGVVELSIVDVTGRVVADLASGLHEAGVHHVSWNTGHGGTAVTPGLYFIKLKAGGIERTKKLVVL
jgi:hypothetical protein